MATLSKTDFEARYNHVSVGLFKDNATNDISEADLRDLVTYIKDCFQSDNFRGGYDGSVNLFPSSGGSGTSGAIQAGDKWRLTATMTIGGTDIYAAGTVIESIINAPGQTTTNWLKYAMQA